MSSCFSCGISFNGSELSYIRAYQQLYEQFGILSYYYKTSTNGELKIIRKEYFNIIFETEIKPNFKNGAEYARIDEFK